MSAEENKAIIRRWTDVWNTGELGALEEIIAPNYIDHVSGSTIRPESGPEFYRQAVAGHRAIFPDHYGYSEALIVEGDIQANGRRPGVRLVRRLARRSPTQVSPSSASLRARSPKNGGSGTVLVSCSSLEPSQRQHRLRRRPKL
jgi:hypothetical protein